jgi:hypothetical protein
MTRLVILESPFAGKGNNILSRWWNKLVNVTYAEDAMRDSLLRGESPMASHLLYTQALDDNVPHEREIGINAGLAWGKVAEATVVYTDRGISRGMQYGIDNAKKAGRPVEYRTLKGW